MPSSPVCLWDKSVNFRPVTKFFRLSFLCELPIAPVTCHLACMWAERGGGGGLAAFEAEKTGVMISKLLPVF